jgi:repressor LexA
MTSTTVALTERQEEILRFIAMHIDINGFQPSFREMMDRFKIRSPNGITAHLRALEKKGVIASNYQTSRAISFAWKEWL